MANERLHESLVQQLGSVSAASPSKSLLRARFWAGVGIAFALVASIFLNAGRFYITLAFWASAAILIAVRRALTREVLKQLQNQPCARCGERHTRAFAGKVPHIIDPPLRLCSKCEWAQIEYIDNLIIYEGAALMQGEIPLFRNARAAFGDKAVDALALLRVAELDLDLARRVLTEESWQEWRPWLEKRLPPKREESSSESSADWP